jgi:ketosteroid isomerase-like protein
MGSAEQEATAVFHAFYEALDDLIQSKGTEKMSAIWLHADHATTAHPFGGWARGWDEVLANWQEGAAVFGFYKGHATRNEPIGGIHDLKVNVSGDIAIATSVYKSTLHMSDGPMHLKVNCTNIAQRVNGAWKIIHHHSDQAPPEWQASIGRMVETGQS